MSGCSLLSYSAALLWPVGAAAGCPWEAPERQYLPAGETPPPHVCLFETLCPELMGSWFLSLSRAVWAFNGLGGALSTFPRPLSGTECTLKKTLHTHSVWGFLVAPGRWLPALEGTFLSQGVALLPRPQSPIDGWDAPSLLLRDSGLPTASSSPLRTENRRAPVDCASQDEC